ncbi:MAG TPA: PDZ domain-containing protein [Persephonella sp.]|nr:PDZ domain-containing protein [Hydrogenothermaceae bacterium]HIQ25058.1 PDZ domain-containing protein [Persephonella sp.]
MVKKKFFYYFFLIWLTFIFSCEKKNEKPKEEKNIDYIFEIQEKIANIVDETNNSIITVISSPKHIKFYQSFEDFKTNTLGSGFVIEKDNDFLYILTNSHVIEGKNIKVIFNKDYQKVAKLVGKDDKSDIAVLKVEIDEKLKNIKPLKVGSSKKLKVGYFVLSAGSPYNLGHTYTFGIVSALHRNLGFSAYEDYIQTDAPINPGNSGGALLNMNGEVVGMNIAVVQSGEGIGFALPIETVLDIYNLIKKYGKVPRGWLGVLVQKLSKKVQKQLGIKEGVIVIKVFKNSPAKKAGIKVGDIILKINGIPITSPQNLAFFIQRLRPNTKLRLEILRNGKPIKIEVIIK